MTKAGVKICRIPGAILYHSGLSLPEKVFLGLVWSFPAGLKLNNAEIGRIVCLYPDNITRLAKKLEREGWVKITGNGSRWRRIYFVADDKVKEDSTLLFSGSTLLLGTEYLVAHDKQNRRKKEKRKKTDSPFPFSVSETTPDFETTPEPVPPQEPDKPTLESLKAQADPAMVRRVFESLGFAEGMAL